MIKSLAIENYKSIKNLSLDLGRINVFIGENGCGKSNILETLAFAAAAESKKLDNEFLTSRGVRVTSPNLMRSCFPGVSTEAPIEITIGFSSIDNRALSYRFENDNEPYSKWVSSKVRKNLNSNLADTFNVLESYNLNLKELREAIKKIEENYLPKGKSDKEILNDKKFKDTIFYLKEFINEKKLQEFDYFSNETELLKGFLIFSPENTALRNFYKEGQVEPLGINGEGLLKLLKVITEKKSNKIEIINDALRLFGWYESFIIPSSLSEQDDKILIQDRFIPSRFDQRSANEGFLFVLFYVALLTSEDTPMIFAVDNIDASLNPKLCTKLIQTIVELAKKNNKQLFFTTHNPAILDGLDLNDEEQKLFVISRNNNGYTRAKKVGVKNKPVSATGEELKLSEALLRGYLGGLPKGF